MTKTIRLLTSDIKDHLNHNHTMKKNHIGLDASQTKQLAEKLNLLLSNYSNLLY